MAIFPIRKFGDPVLRRPAAPVEKVDDSVTKLMRDLQETMRSAPGVGLAAPQIGVSRRVIVWEYEENGGGLANPRIVDRRGEVQGDEACLSLPGLTFPVSRAEWVRVEGLDKNGNEVTLELQDWPARILQHEIDHIEGVLFIDRLPPELAKEARRALREQTLAGTEPKASAVL